jgi:hypothetical protein
MRLYALVEAGDPEAIDVYLCEEDGNGRSTIAYAMSRNGASYCASRRSTLRTPKRCH